METPKTQRFTDLSELALRAHIAFAVRALDTDGAMEVTIQPGFGPIPIWNRVFATKPPELEIQFSAGHLGREQIVSLRDAFEAADFEFTSRQTKQRKELSRILIRCSTTDALGAVSAVKTLECAATALCAKPPFLFSVYHRGQFREDYQIRDDDPLEPSALFVAGHRVGRVARSIVDAFSDGR